MITDGTLICGTFSSNPAAMVSLSSSSSEANGSQVSRCHRHRQEPLFVAGVDLLGRERLGGTGCGGDPLDHLVDGDIEDRLQHRQLAELGITGIDLCHRVRPEASGSRRRQHQLRDVLRIAARDAERERAPERMPDENRRG